MSYGLIELCHTKVPMRGGRVRSMEASTLLCPCLQLDSRKCLLLKKAHVHDLLEAEKASLSVVINLIAEYP